jgi:hypothetical protein
MYKTFAAHRTLEARAYFGCSQFQLSHGTAQGVAVHAQFFSGLTLVATVCPQDL